MSATKTNYTAFSPTSIKIIRTGNLNNDVIDFDYAECLKWDQHLLRLSKNIRIGKFQIPRDALDKKRLITVNTVLLGEVVHTKIPNPNEYCPKLYFAQYL